MTLNSSQLMNIQCNFVGIAFIYCGKTLMCLTASYQVINCKYETLSVYSWLSINRFDTIAKKRSPPLINFWSAVGWNLGEIQMRNVDRSAERRQTENPFVDVLTMNEVICRCSDDEWSCLSMIWRWMNEHECTAH